MGRLAAVLLLLALAAGIASARSETRDNLVGGKVPAEKPAPGSVNSSVGRKAVTIAKRYLGVKYTWGGSSPKTGFDCSGLTMYVYAQLGISLTHYTGAQWHEGYRVSRSLLKRGDLVFFDKSKDGPQHEGMYVGNGKFIQAPHTGDVVKISSLKDGSYAKRYVGAVRPYGLGPPIIFPVVGRVHYSNDFGKKTPHGPHQGTNVIAPRKAVVTAPEGGIVKLSHSKTGGCTVTLYGKSLITYVFMHLNNDLTGRNDNEGHCGGGTSYAPTLWSGATVRGGQVIGFVGDSGDADGTAPHLDFELHPRRGAAVNPYPYLNRADRLLFAALPGKYELRLTGTLDSIDATDPSAVVLTMKVDRMRVQEGNFLYTKVNRTLAVSVVDTTLIQQQTDEGTGDVTIDTLEQAPEGQPISIWTAPAKQTLDAQFGRTVPDAATVLMKLDS